MPHAFLATYLNDHLAGSVSALSLLSHLVAAYAGSEVATFADALQQQVATDRDELQRIMATLAISQSTTRRAAAWLSEKVARLKIQADDPAHAGLHLLESLEALSLGIEGKRQLWLALATAADRSPALRVADYRVLIHRAEAQRAAVEQLRLTVARETLLA